MPGLRREEVALLAGVSTDYYARLEQGCPINPSPAVVEALCRALGLDVAGRAHWTLTGSGTEHERQRRHDRAQEQ
ncbi:helix-turn-helix domain-containing protein [Streptosporangium amethystogenes subsp. fukuiense]|uniref:Helix-turn-helix domain-containing protein n=1 Tax=Streptosporangium amethystogenes subsp. fukuiense TaxID=698418 RepID=A0ABW2TB97_9ACTN